MNVIEEGQAEGSSENFKDSESVSEFYGGIVYKQNENRSEYHFGNSSGSVEADDWNHVRLIRDKCINLYRKYTSK